MTESCNPLNCLSFSNGWCEYDLSTDTIYPAEPENCPLMKKEEK